MSMQCKAFFRSAQLNLQRRKLQQMPGLGMYEVQAECAGAVCMCAARM